MVVRSFSLSSATPSTRRIERVLWVVAAASLAAFLIARPVPFLGGAPDRASLSTAGPAEPAGPPPAPETIAPFVLLMDADSGALLVTREAHAPAPPGALTKLAAALVLLERNDLDEAVRLSREAVQRDGFTLDLIEGEEAPVRSLLTWMLYRPGVEGVLALAEHAAGSEGAFVEVMNAEVRRAGAGSSRFTDLLATDEAVERSSVYDVAMIARAALSHPAFATMVATRRARLELGGRRRDVMNYNSFLWRYPGARGIVSGYTPDTGHSLVGLAERDGRRLLVVVFGAPDADARYEDARSLLDYGFAHLEALTRAPHIDGIEYQVLPGDTLSSLARRHNVPAARIREVNGLSDPDRLESGQTIWIPK